jgi:hypothetical protein
VIAGPGQSLYVWKDVNRLPVAVIDELPFQLEIVQPNVPIVRKRSHDAEGRGKEKGRLGRSHRRSVPVPAAGYRSQQRNCDPQGADRSTLSAER